MPVSWATACRQLEILESGVANIVEAGLNTFEVDDLCDLRAARTNESAMCEHLFVTSQGRPYAQFQRALKTRNAHLAIAAAAELRQIGLVDALSLCLLIRDDDPLRYDRAAVRWVALLLDRDRALHLGDLRELAELLQRVGHHDQVAQLRLERWLRARGYGDEPDRVA